MFSYHPQLVAFNNLNENLIVHVIGNVIRQHVDFFQLDL